MKISLGSDHAGYPLKEFLKGRLLEHGHEIFDFGVHGAEPASDYPLTIQPAARAVVDGHADRAIVLGGSGNGEAMSANKVPGIRCAMAWTEEVARLSREHNDANALALGARLVDFELAWRLVRVWLDTSFAGGRHLPRIQLLEQTLTAELPKAERMG
ncbi:MAG: RpiB/LacA/LacB family sugar-phosphate isomerase [Verrucomicrobiales bacterium]